MTSPLAVIKARLEASGVVGGATGWYLQLGYQQDDNNQSVAVIESGGGGAVLTSGLENIRPYGITVLVRGNPNEYQNPRDKANAVIDSLSYHRSSGKSIIYENGPMYLGKDLVDRHEFSVNFKVWDA